MYACACVYIYVCVCLCVCKHIHDTYNGHQVSLKGLQFLKTLPNNLFEEVNGFVYAPNAPHYDTELLEASFDGEEWSLAARSHVLY